MGEERKWATLKSLGIANAPPARDGGLGGWLNRVNHDKKLKEWGKDKKTRKISEYREYQV